MRRKIFSFSERAWTGLLAVVAVLFRFLPYVARTGTWNLSPVGAVGIYGGSRLGGWLAFVLPVLIMATSDAVLWVWQGFNPFNLVTPFVYTSFLIYVLLGYGLLQKPTVLRIGGVAVLGSIQFFLLTNFAVWLQASIPAQELGGAAWAEFPGDQTGYTLIRYSADLQGLLACYWMGLPFIRGTLIGDLVFSYALFFIHAWLIEPAREAETLGWWRPLRFFGWGRLARPEPVTQNDAIARREESTQERPGQG
jgi:hypothetical protein